MHINIAVVRKIAYTTRTDIFATKRLPSALNAFQNKGALVPPTVQVSAVYVPDLTAIQTGRQEVGRD